MTKVRADRLLLIASGVWILAGLNIARLGVESACAASSPAACIVAGASVIFLLFHMMFSRLVGKHADRIRGYGDDRMHVLRFFDVKSYLIMAFMMGGGIALRQSGLIPDGFIAFFYSGLGAALTLAGIGFALHYIKRGGYLTCPVTKKRRLA